MNTLIPTEQWEYGSADAVRGLIAAVTGGRAACDQEIPIAELGLCIPVRSARAAIILALKALSLPPGSSVAVPLYCCPVVLNSIQAAGCRARFIDVNPETYCLSASDLAAKSSEVDAVVAVHMFGNMCDMPALRQAAPGKPIIEDCAQALRSRLHGRIAGSFGDVAVFSFRSGKYISAGEGGAVYSSSSELRWRISELVHGFPIPGWLDESVHVVKTYLRSQLRSRPLWGAIGNRLWSAYTERGSATAQAPIVMGRIYHSDHKTIIRRLAAIDHQIDMQRSNAQYYTRSLRIDASAICGETPGARFNRLQFPILLPTSRQCEQMVSLLHGDKISTARPYKNIALLAAARYGYTGDCPQAEMIARSVLVIPCSYSISNSDRKRIATSVSRAWGKVVLRHTNIGVLPVNATSTK